MAPIVPARKVASISLVKSCLFYRKPTPRPDGIFPSPPVSP